MKVPMIDKDGIMVVDMEELYRLSEERELDTSDLPKRDMTCPTTRACKKCGKKFTLGIPYDEHNSGHDLCEDCILEQEPAQKYPEKTIQIEQCEIDAQPTEYKEEYNPKKGEDEEE